MKKIFFIFSCIVFFAVSSFSVSAAGYIDSVFTMRDGTKVVTYDQYPELFMTEFTEDFFIKSLSNKLGYEITDYYYFINVGRYSKDDRFVIDFAIFDKSDGLNNNTLYLSNESVINYNSALSCGQGAFFIKLGYLDYIHYNNALTFRSYFNYNGYVGLITNIPTINYDGVDVKDSIDFNLDVDYDEDYNCNISVTTTDSNNDYLVGFGLVNPDYEHIKYSFFEGGRYSLSFSQPVDVSFNVKDFYDTCQDYPEYSDNLTIVATVLKRVDSETAEVVELLTKDINVKEIMESNKGLFSEKKDYIALPSLDDYIDSFPDFPEWDGEHPIDSIWNIVKWVGECLVIIGKNLIGFFKWLGECIWVIIQNIGIGLYNLIVDLRRLLIYLFKPSSEFFNNELNSFKKTFNEKFSVISAVGDFWEKFWNNLDNNTSPPEWTFTWKGNELLAVDFSMFSEYRSTIHKIILAIAWVLFLKYIYKSLPSLISSMPNL